MYVQFASKRSGEIGARGRQRESRMAQIEGFGEGIIGGGKLAVDRSTLSCRSDGEIGGNAQRQFLPERSLDVHWAGSDRVPRQAHGAVEGHHLPGVESGNIAGHGVMLQVTE